MTSLDALKDSSTCASGDMTHLINQLALLARAGKKEYGLTEDQVQQLVSRFFKILDAYPEIHVRVMEACNEDRRFWQQPADTQLKYLDRAGLLVDTLGV